MTMFVIRCWLLLLCFDRKAKSRDPRALEKAVSNQRTLKRTAPPSYEMICRAMDYACVLYFKKVWCRQRSAATTVLLRRHGWNAKMITGAQIIPFRSHAWVEIDGHVVNDKPYMHEIYQFLHWC
jgi:hypothetical protein